MTKLEDFRDESWQEDREIDGQVERVTCQQIVGKSGVYLVISLDRTGEVIQDGRPWQMREGVS